MRKHKAMQTKERIAEMFRAFLISRGHDTLDTVTGEDHAAFAKSLSNADLLMMMFYTTPTCAEDLERHRAMSNEDLLKGLYENNEASKCKTILEERMAAAGVEGLHSLL
jgi:hypothetical protein